jgi:hypothetical protein
MRRIILYFCSMVFFFALVIIIDLIASQFPIPRGASHSVAMRYLTIPLFVIFPPFLAMSLYRTKLSVTLYSIIFIYFMLLSWPGLMLRYYAFWCGSTYAAAIITMVAAGALSRASRGHDAVSVKLQVLCGILVVLGTLFPFLALLSFSGVRGYFGLFGIFVFCIFSAVLVTVPPRLPLLYSISVRSMLAAFLTNIIWNLVPIRAYLPFDGPIPLLQFLYFRSIGSLEDVTALFGLFGLYAAILLLLLPLRRTKTPSETSYWV